MANELITNDSAKKATELIEQHRGAFEDVGQLVSEFSELGEDSNELVRTLHMANALTVIVQKLTPATPLIRSLMDSPVGFKTDEPSRREGGKPGYEDKLVLEMVAAALLDGYRLYNNEFNIIAGNYMPVKNGLKRKCQECENIRAIDMDCSIPYSKASKMLVDVVCRYQMKNTDSDDWVDCWFQKTFAIRVNSGMGDDAIIGKAERRGYKLLLENATGKVMNQIQEDGIEEEVPPETQRKNDMTIDDALSPSELDSAASPDEIRSLRIAAFQKTNNANIDEDLKVDLREKVIQKLKDKKQSLK